MVLAEVTPPPPLEVGGGGRMRSKGGDDICVENPTLIRVNAFFVKQEK